jgi:hypothetical protein
MRWISMEQSPGAPKWKGSTEAKPPARDGLRRFAVSKGKNNHVVE